MKRYITEDKNTCMVKLKNKRVYVQRINKERIGISFKMLDSINPKPVIISDRRKPNLLDLEITETGILLSIESAFALRTALDSIIRLRDIPMECLALNDN
jgi:hypothetical protein